jgi:hypothetical protein
LRRVLVAGLLGGLVMVIWLVVADGILGFKRGIEMNQLPQERRVYAFLMEHVTQPGRYVLNPEVLPEQRFPGDAPIFSVQYSGLGHADAGQEVIVGLVVMLMSPVVGAWLLANASGRVHARYGSRVGFFAAIGLVIALLGLGARFGLAAYSIRDASLLAVHDLGAWFLAGLVVAWVVGPTCEAAKTRAG